MTYDFENRAGETFGFNQFFGPVLLELAKRYGWEPQGTEPPEYWADEEPHEWRGQYIGNQGQIVTALDANALADAMEAVPADPNIALVLYELRPDIQKQADEWTYFPTTIASFTSPDSYRSALQKFVIFCRKGEFEIH